MITKHFLSIKMNKIYFIYILRYQYRYYNNKIYSYFENYYLLLLINVLIIAGKSISWVNEASPIADVICFINYLISKEMITVNGIKENNPCIRRKLLNLHAIHAIHYALIKRVLHTNIHIHIHIWPRLYPCTVPKFTGSQVHSEGYWDISFISVWKSVT